MKFLLVCLLHIIFVTFVQGNIYNGYKVYEVAIESRTEIVNTLLPNILKNSTYYELFPSTFTSPRILVHPDAQDSFVAQLNANSLKFTIVNDNVGDALHKEFENNSFLRTYYPYNGRLTNERYYTHEEINQYLEEVAAKYPNRVFLKTVGRTYEGRWLKTLTITNGDHRTNKNVIFMDGGFHAREWISPAAVVHAIGELVENPDTYADILLDYDWVILPVVNADGYEYTQLSSSTRLWRKTRKPSSDDCIGTDPNRNFDFHWNEEGASQNPCASTYAGSKAFSEPETVVVRDLLHTFVGRGKMYLTLHSYGNLILYPWGWTSDLPDTVDDLHEVAEAGFEAIRDATGTLYTIGSSTNVLYVAAGASDDYAFNAGFPISFTMELPAGGANSFDPPASDIERLVTETWVGIVAMARKVVEKYPLN